MGGSKSAVTPPFRTGSEHRNLKFSQLTLVPGTDREPEKLLYVSFGEKNNLRGLKQCNVRQKRIERYTMQ